MCLPPPVRRSPSQEEEALQAERQQDNTSADEEHGHTLAFPQAQTGVIGG